MGGEGWGGGRRGREGGQGGMERESEREGERGNERGMGGVGRERMKEGEMGQQESVEDRKCRNRYRRFLIPLNASLQYRPTALAKDPTTFAERAVDV